MNTRQIPLLAPLAAMLVLPVFLRRRMSVARSVLIRARPAAVFPFVNDLRNWPLWTAGAGCEGLHYDYSGPTSGVGASKAWRSGAREARLRIVQSAADERVVYELASRRGQRVVEGVIALDSLDGLTRVRWRVKWEGSGNAFGRYLDLVQAWRAWRRMEGALESLREGVEREVGRPRGPGGGGGLGAQ